MATDINKSKFLKKIGISENVQSVNEGMSDLDFVIIKFQTQWNIMTKRFC